MSTRNRLIRASSLVVLGLFCGRSANADSWTVVAPMPTPRFYLGAAAGPDGGIYAIGGEDNVHILSVVEKYTPSTNTWQSVAPLPIPVTGVSVTAGLDGRIYAIGGLTDPDAVSGAVQVYDPSAPTPAWTSVAPLPVPVFWAAATTGADGHIYVMGGYPTIQGSQPGVDTVQIYDPVSNSWSIAAPISVPRYVLAAATGPDGRVYALPGASVSGTINVTEAYTPSTNSWSTVASPNTARQAEAAVTSSDGRIFAIGGADAANNLFATVEAYSTGTNTWTDLAPLNVARAALAAAKGLDGKIYAFGGRTTSFGPLNTVEVYNTVTLTPASVPFLLLRTVGTTSPTHTVKLTNVGSAQLDITGITLTGPNPGDFAQSNNCPPTVASGASCLITVTFTPAAQGVRTAVVSITDNAPASPQTVPLSGRGTFLKWSPRSINIGDQKVDTSSPAHPVKVTNAGPAPITIYSIEIAGVNPGDFSQTNNCGSSLNPRASCTIQVRFTPTAVGGRLGHVAIRDSAFGGTHWVGLLGKGK
jgi:N-acetylneuraminic acid mutarotase